MSRRVPLPGAFLPPGVARILEGVTHALRSGQPTPAYPLWITTDVSPRLFILDGGKGVRISAWQSGGISSFAGVDTETYLVLCGTLGLLQWRTLASNPVLIEEDFAHPPSQCILSARESKPEYALLFESPRLCSGCAEFYRLLGSSFEAMAVEALLSAIRVHQSASGVPDFV